jgi:endonuclease YncB( thermonuclease family)
MPEQSEGLCANVIDGGLAQEGGSTRQAELKTPRSVAGRGAAAGISTQTLSREEDATAAESSRYRCERRSGALAAWENDKRIWYTSLEDTQALMTTKFPFIVLAWCVHRQCPAPTPERAHISHCDRRWEFKNCARIFTVNEAPGSSTLCGPGRDCQANGHNAGSAVALAQGKILARIDCVG